MAHNRAHRVGFRLAGFHQCVEQVNVDRLGKYVHTVRQREDKSSFRVLVEVTLEHGRKHIYFTSSVVVENKLSMAVDLRLFDPETGKTEDIGRVNSKESVAVHLLRARDHLCFRPSSQGFQCVFVVVVAVVVAGVVAACTCGNLRHGLCLCD